MEWILRLFFRGRKMPSSYKFRIKVQRYLRAFVYMFNIHTLVLLVTSCFSVFVCLKLHLRYNMVSMADPKHILQAYSVSCRRGYS